MLDLNDYVDGVLQSNDAARKAIVVLVGNGSVVSPLNETTPHLTTRKTDWVSLARSRSDEFLDEYPTASELTKAMKKDGCLAVIGLGDKSSILSSQARGVVEIALRSVDVTGMRGFFIDSVQSLLPYYDPWQHSGTTFLITRFVPTTEEMRIIKGLFKGCKVKPKLYHVSTSEQTADLFVELARQAWIRGLRISEQIKNLPY